MDLDKLKRLALNTHDSREYAIMVQNFFEMNRNVDPFYIAKTLGITVVPMPLSKNLFSFATIKDNQKYIFVNGYSPISRQRYNVALQMYLLLRGKSNVAYYKDHDKTTVISNAKTFAANLLLPPEALKEEVEKYKDKNGYISYYDIFY